MLIHPLPHQRFSESGLYLCSVPLQIIVTALVLLGVAGVYVQLDAKPRAPREGAEQGTTLAELVGKVFDLQPTSTIRCSSESLKIRNVTQVWREVGEEGHIGLDALFAPGEHYHLAFDIN